MSHLLRTRRKGLLMDKRCGVRGLRFFFKLFFFTDFFFLLIFSFPILFALITAKVKRHTNPFFFFLINYVFIHLFQILFRNLLFWGLGSVKRDDRFVCRSRKRQKQGKTMTCSQTKAATCPPTSTSNSRRSSSQPATTRRQRQHNHHHSNSPFSRTRLPPPANPSSLHPPSKTPPTGTPTRTRLRRLRRPRSRTTRCTSCPTASPPSHLPTRSTTS